MDTRVRLQPHAQGMQVEAMGEGVEVGEELCMGVRRRGARACASCPPTHKWEMQMNAEYRLCTPNLEPLWLFLTFSVEMGCPTTNLYP